MARCKSRDHPLKITLSLLTAIRCQWRALGRRDEVVMQISSHRDLPGTRTTEKSVFPLVDEHEGVMREMVWGDSRLTVCGGELDRGEGAGGKGDRGWQLGTTPNTMGLWVTWLVLRGWPPLEHS